VIPIDEEFSSGDMTTPAHPNCHCSIGYISEGKGKEVSEKHAQRAIERTKQRHAKADADDEA